MELIDRARNIAEEAHAEQVRKTDKSPYINHPLAVAEIVKRYGFDEVTQAAALVHDVLEDTAITETELRNELGDAVTDIVIAVSEDKNLEWEDRKRDYIKQVVAAKEAVKAVSVADKIHNALALIDYHKTHGVETWTKFNRGREEKLWFERTLCNELKTVWQHPLLDEYERLVVELEHLA